MTRGVPALLALLIGSLAGSAAPALTAPLPGAVMSYDDTSIVPTVATDSFRTEWLYVKAAMVDGNVYWLQYTFNFDGTLLRSVQNLDSGTICVLPTVLGVGPPASWTLEAIDATNHRLNWPGGSLQFAGGLVVLTDVWLNNGLVVGKMHPKFHEFDVSEGGDFRSTFASVSGTLLGASIAPTPTASIMGVDHYSSTTGTDFQNTTTFGASYYDWVHYQQGTDVYGVIIEVRPASGAPFLRASFVGSVSAGTATLDGTTSVVLSGDACGGPPDSPAISQIGPFTFPNDKVTLHFNVPGTGQLWQGMITDNTTLFVGGFESSRRLLP